MLFSLLLASPTNFSLPAISFTASMAEKKKCGYWHILVGIVHIRTLSKSLFLFTVQECIQSVEVLLWSEWSLGQKMTGIQLNFEIVI